MSGTTQQPATIQLYDTLTRRKAPLETIEPGVVRMYVCGITPYDRAHIGHAMSYIFFDVLRRYLQHRGYAVRHAQNFTDIDDKIIARAAKLGVTPDELTRGLIDEWHADTRALGILPADVYPLATEEIGPIIAMIEDLIAKGSAYPVGGDVYYRVRSFPEYGKLSHRNLDDLLAGARIDVDERKGDPLDFALWKAAKPGEPTWPSPWGPGRPGWHIECSAMCTTHLDGAVDIHGGGADLIFPHHENEIAQSEAFLGRAPFARFWVHNGLLRLGGEKMSKSLGNLVPMRDLIDRGLGAAFRLMVLQSHYRSPLTYTDEGLLAADRGLDRLRAAATDQEPSSPILEETDDTPVVDLAARAHDIDARFHAAMDDDLDTPLAVAALFELGRAINRARSEGTPSNLIDPARVKLIALANVLGLSLAPEFQSSGNDAAPYIDLLVSVRDELRAAKQFSVADRIRTELDTRGITIEDAPTGSTWARRKA